jgi:lipid-A-disaccharide synthase
VKTFKVFISAIEPSSDMLGAELMQSLKKKHPHIEFQGLGGPQMRQQGLISLFPTQELALMGFAEVLPKLWMILKRIQQTVQMIRQYQPDMVLTLDGLSFHNRVVKKLQDLRPHTSFIQYVAPAVWAWKPSRAKKIAKLYDQLLVIFPFEPPYFEQEGLKTQFVGHPVLKRIKPQKIQQLSTPHIILLPGSRLQEVTRHLPIFLEAAQKIAAELPNCQFTLPTIPDLQASIETLIRTSPVSIKVITEPHEKYLHFQQSSFAIAASGSVSLELAVCGLPALISYRVSSLTYQIAKRLARVNYICMVNILLNRLLVPELIQDDCNASLIAETTLAYLKNSEKLTEIKSGYQAVLTKLAAPKYKNPSDYAAEIIYNTLNQ